MLEAAVFDGSPRKSCACCTSIRFDPAPAVLIADRDQQIAINTDWRMTMNRSTRALVNVAFAALVLAPAGLSPAIAAGSRQIAMMDDDKMSKMPAPQDSSGKMNMGQPAGQPNMSGGAMNDDKMKMPSQGQMRDCKGAGCQDNSGMMPMMQMMEKMMRGQMSLARRKRCDERPGGRDGAARGAHCLSEGRAADQ